MSEENEYTIANDDQICGAVFKMPDGEKVARIFNRAEDVENATVEWILLRDRSSLDGKTAARLEYQYNYFNWGGDTLDLMEG